LWNRKYESILASIHDTGILHGDIRRGNLLRSKSGKATLIDFSHASWRQDVRAEKWDALAAAEIGKLGGATVDIEF
jgi:tRNA A-37 threonylcarbamoyl transferase component Bud32